MLMRLFPLATILAGLALPPASPAFAADLARRHAALRKRIVRVDPYEKPVEQMYSRPVAGFYGYPFDYAVPEPKSYFRTHHPVQEPYVLRRDAPHGIQVME